MLIPFLSATQNLFIHSTVGLPPQIWWLPALVLLILGSAALIDTVSSTIPDPVILMGLIAVTATQGTNVSWDFAAMHLTYALAAGLIIWGINQIWFRLMKADAIGMGDAKWTMLAVACFDVLPAIYAWGIGACLAIVWIGLTRVTRHKIARVYFAPFLFIGLIAGLYWLRLRV